MYYYLGLLQAKHFLLQHDAYNSDTAELRLKVILLDLGLTTLSFPSEGRKMWKSNSPMQCLVSYLYRLRLKGEKYTEYHGANKNGIWKISLFG